VDNRGDKFARRMSCSVLLAVMSLTPTVCGAGDRTDGRLDCRRLANCLACTRVDLACCLTCVPGTGGSGNPGRRPCWVLTVVVAVTLTRTSEWPRCRCLPVFCSNQGSSATGCLPRKVQRMLRTEDYGMSPGIPRNRSPVVGSLQFTNPALTRHRSVLPAGGMLSCFRRTTSDGRFCVSRETWLVREAAVSRETSRSSVSSCCGNFMPSPASPCLGPNSAI